jgi:predicted peroxiredoxin
MTDKVLIVMTSGPDTPHRCATPFFYASLGAAMDYEVDMFFTMDGSLLLKKGLADNIYPKAGGKSVGEFLKDALNDGVRFSVCTASLELNDLKPEDLIEGVKLVGGASMWQMADDSKTLTF